MTGCLYRRFDQSLDMEGSDFGQDGYLQLNDSVKRLLSKASLLI